MRPCTALLFALMAASTAGANPADEAFRALTQTEWAWRLADSPQLASGVGVHDYDDRLSHVDAKAQAARLTYLEGVLRQLNAIDAKTLSASEQVNYVIYHAQISDAVADLKLKTWLMPLNSDSSFYGDLSSLAGLQSFDTAHDYENYLKRLASIPAYFDEHIAVMKQGMREGMTVPQVVLRGRDAPIRSMLESMGVDDKGHATATTYAFFTPFNHFPASINEAEQQRLRGDLQHIIDGAVIPAYNKLLKFYNEEYLPKARRSIAATSLPNGKAYYRQQIREYTTLDLSPEEIHAIGVKEVARIHAEMESVMREAKFDGDFAAFLAFLRSDAQFYAKTPDELMMRARDIAKRIDGKLPAFFSTLPRLPYGVEPVPSAIAPYYTGGRYVPASVGSKDAGTFWVNTYDLPSRPLYVLPALALHEAVPGHHLQGALAGEQGEQPPFRRNSYISAYGEGWALYSEHLGVEMGIYRTPYEHFGRLTYEMWRACRLVVDTGMHAMGWSRERAIAYLHDNTALSQHEIETEIDRYISWPGQALSYKLGELKIRELRARAEKELGDKFDLRAFHDAILSLGSVPLPLLEAHITAWTAQQRTTARSP